MKKERADKYIGLVGRHYFTEKTYIDVEYEPLHGVNEGMFIKRVTVHAEFDKVDEVNETWHKVLSEMEAGALGSSQFVNDALYNGICTCGVRYNQGRGIYEDALKNEYTVYQYGWRLDGLGRIRRK